MKNYKRTLLVLFIVLSIVLGSLLVITGCPTPFTPSDLDMHPHIPADISGVSSGSIGMGTFSLSIEGSQSQGRTIMPDTGAANNRFAIYRLEFTGNTTGLSTVDVDRSFGEIGNAIELIPGSYTLKVSGYTSTENRTANKPAAQGTNPSITISPNAVATGTVNLLPITGSDLKGIFDLNITYIDGLSAVTMELQPISPSGNNTLYNIHGGGPNPLARNANLELDPGQYRVIFTLERDLSNPVKWFEVLHIAGNMTSSYIRNFSLDYFAKRSYTITFMIDGTSVGDQTYFHDDNSVTAYAPTNKDGHTLSDWYTAPDLATPYTFETALTGNTTVYAKWIPDFPGVVHISILTKDDNGLDVEVIRSNVDQGETLKANVTPPLTGLGYQWKQNGVDIDGATSQTLLITSELVDVGGNITVTISLSGYNSKTSTSVLINAAPGTSGNPFLVRNFTDLIRVGSNFVDPSGATWSLDKHYRQTVSFSSGGQSIAPKGTDVQGFTGSYDGDGFEIRNMTINSPSADNLALFAFIGAEGIVRNVVLENVNITGRNNVGGIAAVNNGQILNSHVNGNITGRNNVGGIAGNNANLIQNSFSGGSVVGTLNIGGITGLNNSNIEYCYSISMINAHNNYAGGIAGRNDGSITNSIALNANITSNLTNIGRIAGNGSTANKARGDMELRITDQDNQGDNPVPAGDLGTSVAVGSTTSMRNNVFNGWSTSIWTIPDNNLIVTAELPLLVVQKVRTHPLRLPVVILLPNATNTNPRDFNVSEFIRFNQTGGERGWFVRQLTGNWVLGEMIEVEATGDIDLPDTIKTALNSNISSITTTQASLGNIGHLSLVKQGNGNGALLIVTLTLNIPVSEAYVSMYFGHQDTSRSPSDVIYYTGNNVITRTYTVGTHVSNGADFTVGVYIKAEENWRLNNVMDVPTIVYPYPVFTTFDNVFQENTFYWLDGDLGKSSKGNIQFCTVAGYRFIPPSIEELLVATNYTLSNRTVFVPADSSGTFVLDTVNGPIFMNAVTQFGQPLVLNHSYANYAGINSTRTYDLTLSNGDNIGTAEVILVAALTGSSGSTYVFTANQPITVQIIMHLRPEFDQFVKGFNIINLNTGTSEVSKDVSNRTFTLSRNGSSPASSSAPFNFTINFVY